MLVLENLHKSFKLQQAKPILNNISLTLKQGDFCMLVGSNGSGKSTLLKIILGEYLPDTGSITLNQLPITHLPTYKRAQYIGCVFQDVLQGTVSEMTVMENLSLALMRGRSAHFRTHKKNQSFFETQLSLLNMGLENRLHTLATNLSGGQRQALAFTMATLHSPDLLLLDEHCSALDPKSSQHIMNRTTKIIEQANITTLMVTHNLRDAIAHGNRLIMLHEGKIVLDVQKQEKQNLTTEILLNLFHQYEDKSLT